MRIPLSGKLIGLAAGLVAGLLFVILGWKAFLILLGFSLLGLVLGAWVDSHERIMRRLKQFIARMLGT
ncbi:hypothetical protein IH601_05415 [Candidatus Bipolaricaulota bacterium]|jgi:uncharacterized membrane protein|nr:hypothetical protein [Candidatus Bipolaricaulota bacterium]